MSKLILFYFFINQIVSMLSNANILSSYYNLYKINNQEFFSVTKEYESYALIQSFRDGFIGELTCISLYASTFKSRIIIYSKTNGTSSVCKIYQYIPNFNNEVIPSQDYSKIFIRRENEYYINTLNLTSHSGNVKFLNELSNGELLSISSDNTVLIWNITDGSLKKNITGFDIIYPLQNGDIICGSNSQKNFTIFDPTNWKIKNVFTGIILSSALYLKNGDFLISSDAVIWIWNTTSWTIKINFSLPNLGPYICYMTALNNGDLVTSSSDSKIRIWNTTNGNVKYEFVGDHYGTRLAVLKNGNLIMGFNNGSLVVLDPSSRIRVKALNNQEFVVSLEILENGDLICGGSDGKIRIFDVNKEVLKFVLNNSLSIVYQNALKTFDNGDFVISDDKIIKIWKKIN